MDVYDRTKGVTHLQLNLYELPIHRKGCYAYQWLDNDGIHMQNLIKMYRVVKELRAFLVDRQSHILYCAHLRVVQFMPKVMIASKPKCPYVMGVAYISWF